MGNAVGDEIINEMFEITKEISSRTAKTDATLSFMEKRLEAMETLTAKMSETLNEQKHLSSVVDSLVSTVNENKREIQDLRRGMAEQKNLPALKTFEFLKKIGWVLASAFAAAFGSYIIYKFKAIWNGEK